MFRSNTLWLVPVSFLLSSGLGVAPAKVSGSVKTVPEPGTATALLGMSVIGCVGIVLRRQL